MRESDIGKYAADEAVKILNGVQASNIPQYTIKQYTVFINPNVEKSQGINLEELKNAAKQNRYKIAMIGEPNAVTK